MKYSVGLWAESAVRGPGQATLRYPTWPSDYFEWKSLEKQQVWEELCKWNLAL